MKSLIAMHSEALYSIYIIDTYGVTMQTFVKKWGNSASVRIPAAVMEAAGLYLDDPVDVREETGRIVIKPMHSRKYDLAQLLAGITSDNLHAEASFGQVVGNEAF